MTRIAAAAFNETLEDLPPNPRAVPGGNRPPITDLAVIDFNEAIDSTVGLRVRIGQLLDSATRAAATDDETAGRCAELIRQMTAVEKVVEGARAETKGPYLDAGRRVDDTARMLIGDVVTAKGAVRKSAEDYLRAKAAREAEAARQAEAERRRQEDAARAAAAAEAARAREEERAPDAEIMAAPAAVAAKPVEAAPVQVRSDLGALASARKVKIATIVDWPKAFKAVQSVPAVRDAVQKAVNALVRAGQASIPGVEIGDDIGLSVR